VKIRAGATIAVVDPEVTPTSGMLQSDQAAPGRAGLEQAITERAGVGRAVFVEAKRIAEAVFSDHMLANVILLGAAFQSGGLPVSLDDIERAMRRQGRAAASNREAFEWGRLAVHDPAALEAALAPADPSSSGVAPGPFEPSARALATAAELVARRNLPPDLRDPLTRRAAQAVDFQDARRANRFLDLVERTAARDDDSRGWALTRAVAESWFKLLTYKDEYEVARLHLAADYDKAARELGIDGPYSVTYHLHPPILRRLGMSKKLPLGQPYELAFRVLRPMKRLRDTPADIFGWDRDRREERALITEYERVIDEMAAAAVPYEAFAAIAESVLSVRGYGPVKEAAVAAWRAKLADLREHASD
jgi:indolepyruvate ferredoxin oxidoreductase